MTLTVYFGFSVSLITVTSQAPSMADTNLAYLSLVIFTLPLGLLILLYFIVRPRPVKVPIKNRHVFITGGSSGIGLALAQRAAAEGARVSILARSIKRLEEARESIRLATGIEVAIFSADARDYDAVKRAIEEAGEIDVLVVNQGVFTPQELEKQSIEDIRFMIDVNLMGSFNVAKAALPGMKQRKGCGPRSIAFMSSQAGQVGILLLNFCLLTLSWRLNMKYAYSLLACSVLLKVASFFI